MLEFEREESTTWEMHLRMHLLKAIAWAIGGFALIATGTLGIDAAEVTLPVIPSLGGAFLCVCAALAGSALIHLFALTRRWKDTKGPIILLAVTCVIYTLLSSAFAQAIGYGQDAHGWTESVAGGVAFTGGGVAIVLGVGVAIGFDEDWKDWVRIAVMVVLGAVVAEYIDKDTWWIGGIAGALLARILKRAERYGGTPAAAIAACLVSGVTAVVLLAIYWAIRDALKIAFGAGLAGAAHTPSDAVMSEAERHREVERLRQWDREREREGGW